MYVKYFNSFFFSLSFIGKGLIDLSPQEVYNCVRNPNQRYIFDNMLKVIYYYQFIILFILLFIIRSCM